MVTYSTALQVSRRYRRLMGSSLGPLFQALQDDCTWLHQKWMQYVELFGMGEERIDLLDASAGFFFRIVQDSLWAEVLLGLCRLTDPPTSPGRAPRSNLTLRRLATTIGKKRLSQSTLARARKAETKARFARDWRNRYLAHADLTHSLAPRSRPLAKATRQKVRAALDAIAETLNHVQRHYCSSETYYGESASPQDAVALLYVIREGLESEAKRRERLEKAQPTAEDLIAPRAL